MRELAHSRHLDDGVQFLESCDRSRRKPLVEHRQFLAGSNACKFKTRIAVPDAFPELLTLVRRPATIRGFISCRCFNGLNNLLCDSKPRKVFAFASQLSGYLAPTFVSLLRRRQRLRLTLRNLSLILLRLSSPSKTEVRAVSVTANNRNLQPLLSRLSLVLYEFFDSTLE